MSDPKQQNFGTCVQTIIYRCWHKNRCSYARLCTVGFDQLWSCSWNPNRKLRVYFGCLGCCFWDLDQKLTLSVLTFATTIVPFMTNHYPLHEQSVETLQYIIIHSQILFVVTLVHQYLYSMTHTSTVNLYGYHFCRCRYKHHVACTYTQITLASLTTLKELSSKQIRGVGAYLLHKATFLLTRAFIEEWASSHPIPMIWVTSRVQCCLVSMDNSPDHFPRFENRYPWRTVIQLELTMERLQIICRRWAREMYYIGRPPLISHTPRLLCGIRWSRIN